MRSFDDAIRRVLPTEDYDRFARCKYRYIASYSYRLTLLNIAVISRFDKGSIPCDVLNDAVRLILLGYSEMNAKEEVEREALWQEFQIIIDEVTKSGASESTDNRMSVSSTEDE